MFWMLFSLAEQAKLPSHYVLTNVFGCITRAMDVKAISVSPNSWENLLIIVLCLF